MKPAEVNEYFNRANYKIIGSVALTVGALIQFLVFNKKDYSNVFTSYKV